MKERTNRCKKLQLFNTKFLHSHYKPQRQTEAEDPSRTEKIMMNRLIAKSKDENLSEEYREACHQVARELSKEHGEWWLPDAENYDKLTSRNSERERKADLESANPRSVEQFRKWAERQSEITAEMSKAKIDRYLTIRNRVNEEIKKQIDIYKKEIENLNSRIRRNQIQTDKDVNELHNIFGDPF